MGSTCLAYNLISGNPRSLPCCCCGDFIIRSEMPKRLIAAQCAREGFLVGACVEPVQLYLLPQFEGDSKSREEIFCLGICFPAGCWPS